MSANPRDPVPAGIAYPVNPWTDRPLSPVQMARVARLRSEVDVFLRALHELDGTTPGSPPGDRRMALAFTKFDEAVLWAVAAILEHDR